MNSKETNSELERVGSLFMGEGYVVECGTWLGASLKHISDGIGARSANIHCFDKFKPNQSEIEKAYKDGVFLIENEDTRKWIEFHVLPVIPSYHKVTLHRKKLLDVEWSIKKPIEIFVLDAAKLNPSFQHVINVFSKYWIPAAHICLLDAYFMEEDPERSCQRDWLKKHEREFENHRRIGSAHFMQKI